MPREGPEIRTRKVSKPSSRLSPTTCTGMDTVVDPAGIVAVEEAVTKSAPAEAGLGPPTITS